MGGELGTIRRNREGRKSSTLCFYGLDPLLTTSSFHVVVRYFSYFINYISLFCYFNIYCNFFNLFIVKKVNLYIA